MSKEMEKARAIREDTDRHYNCAQAVVCAFAEKAGIDEEKAYQLTAHFGSGMRMGATCGAITGGMMVLGLLGKDDPSTLKQFVDVFRRNHDNLLDCKELLRVNAERGGEKKPHCDAMVYEAVEALEAVL